MSIEVGKKAPEFKLYDTDRKERSLSEFTGKNVVLAFYPGAFTGVCTKELCNFRDTLSKFNNVCTVTRYSTKLGQLLNAKSKNLVIRSPNSLPISP